MQVEVKSEQSLNSAGTRIKDFLWWQPNFTAWCLFKSSGASVCVHGWGKGINHVAMNQSASSTSSACMLSEYISESVMISYGFISLSCVVASGCPTENTQIITGTEAAGELNWSRAFELELPPPAQHESDLTSAAELRSFDAPGVVC